MTTHTEFKKKKNFLHLFTDLPFKDFFPVDRINYSFVILSNCNLF